MDQVFARCVDHLSLSGPSGATLLQITTAATGDAPRPALLRYLCQQFRRRPSLFSSPDWTQPPPTLQLIATLALRNRALGYSVAEHPPLPPRACLLLQHIARSGPAGILQSELAPLVSLSPVMVSHYLGSLSARRLVARKRVVLTTHNAPVSHPGPLSSQPPSRTTATTVIVLARFASVIAASNASKRTTAARGHPHPPILDRSVYPTHPAAAHPTPDVSIHELNVDQGADRILTALRLPPYIRTQRDLKAIAMPDSERPPDCSEDVYQRRRHRAFRAFRVKLLRAGLVEVVDRHCVDAAGASRGLHSCLKLTNAPETHAENESVVASVVVENAEAVSAVEDIDVDKQGDPSQATAVAGRNGPVVHPSAIPQTNDAGFIAEVDLIQQVYNLLRESGSAGLSVPDLVAILDNDTKLTSAPPKRIRNIINGISRFVPIAESQKFEGSAMCLKNVLAEFSDVNPSSPGAGQGKAAAAKLIHAVSAGKAPRMQRRSELGRKKDEITSLGLRRQELILELLQEEKAIVLEKLGRRVAELEKNSSVERVDQKVMRRIVNDLMLQKRIHVLTTLRPSISKRSQTIRLVTLPDLDVNSPEVVRAISTIVSHSLHGKQSTPRAVQKRQVEEKVVRIEEDGSELEDDPKPSRKKRKSQAAKRPRSQAKILQRPNQLSARDQNTQDYGTADSQPNAFPEDISDTPTRDAIVVSKERRDSRNARIGRLTAIDYGWMRGKLARVRKFHEHVYQVVSNHSPKEDMDLSTVQHSTIEASKAAAPLGTFTIQSCLLDMSVSDYSAAVGIYKDHGDVIHSIEDHKISQVMDIMKDEITSTQANRQLTSLVQCLVKLELMQSAKEGKFALCGAGIIRDFGRGMPTGVVPHGIVFSSNIAVELYWKELQQFSHFRYEKLQVGTDRFQQESDQVDNAFQHVLGDVYIRLRWSKGFSYTFTKDEQFQYEVTLQRLSGVNVHTGKDGTISATNFAIGPLKRFTVDQLLDHVQNATAESGQLTNRERYSTTVEKLLFYSRFRSQNGAPEEIRQEARPTDDIAATETCADAPRRIRTVLRLSRGSPSVNRTASTRTVSGGLRPLMRESRTSDFPAVKKPKATEVDTRSKTFVEADRCINALREVIKVRTMTYCTDIGVVPRWNVANLFSSCTEKTSADINSNCWTGMDVALPTRAKKDEAIVGAASPKDENDKRIAKKPNQNNLPRDQAMDEDDVRADGKDGNDAAAAAKGEDGVQADSKPYDALTFRQAIVSLCHLPYVQSVVDIISLRLALRTAAQDLGASKEEMLNKLHAELGCIWKNVHWPLMAAVLECKAEIYRSHRVVLEVRRDSALWSQQERRKLIEREFRLSSNMRLRHGYKLSEQLALLVERYRRVAVLRIKGSMWREFVFRDEDADEVMSLGETNTEPMRVEVMEQVLLSILNAGRQMQKSSDAMSMLNWFRPGDIAKARDRLLIREAICITTTDAMERFFAISKGEKTGGDVTTRHVLQRKSQKAVVWVKGLQELPANEKDDGYCRFRETELGKDASGRKSLESRKAAMVSTELLFFPVEGKGKLRLMPVVALGDGQDGSTIIDGEPADLDVEKDKKEKDAEDSSDEDVNMEDEPSEDRNTAPKTMIDVRCKYVDENVHSGKRDTSEKDAGKQRRMKKKGYKVEIKGNESTKRERELEDDVEGVLKQAGHMGVTLRELLSSDMAQSCGHKSHLAVAVHRLLRTRRAYRLAIETPGHPSVPNCRWTSSCGVLYLHASFTRRLFVQSGLGSGGEVDPRVMCVWSTFQGRACEALAQGVARKVLHVVTRKPGMELSRVLQAVQTAFPALPGRAAADVVFVLERKGALAVTRVRRKKRAFGDGPFGGGGRGYLRREEKDFCSEFVDGRGFVEDEEDLVEAFLHVVPGLTLTEVSAEELWEVGTKAW